MKRYYILVCKETKESDWTVQFGDYTKSVVVAEQEDYDYSGDWYSTGVRSVDGDTQVAIDRRVAELNKKV